MTAYIFDTECTGFDEPQLIEAAYIALDGSDAFQQRYHPSKPISYGAMAVHHIIPDDLLSCPPSYTFELPAECTHLIGHNIDFDWNVIGRPIVRRICTLALSRDVWLDVDSHSVGALTYFLKEDKATARNILRNAHSAMIDVVLTREILQALCKELAISLDHPDAVEQLYDLSEIARVPAYIDFGKHAGKLYEDVPWDYKEWYFRQQDKDPLIEQAMRKPRLCNVQGKPFPRKVW